MIIKKILRFIKKLFGMEPIVESIAEKHKEFTEQTLERFYSIFKNKIRDCNNVDNRNPLYRYKDAISDLQKDKTTISFEFLLHKIVLNYKVDLLLGFYAITYKEVFDAHTYPSPKLVRLHDLDFSIHITAGSHYISYKKQDYNIDNNYHPFLDMYIKNVESKFLSE